MYIIADSAERGVSRAARLMPGGLQWTPPSSQPPGDGHAQLNQAMNNVLDWPLNVMTKEESSLVTPSELNNELLNKVDSVRKMKTAKVTPEGVEDVHTEMPAAAIASDQEMTLKIKEITSHIRNMKKKKINIEANGVTVSDLQTELAEMKKSYKTVTAFRTRCYNRGHTHHGP